jgi:diaminohydroxyphosphoribosylaminopyrimidine deaminase/5-amino-6-(5-phosphoribosylamino)uracil reductase
MYNEIYMRRALQLAENGRGFTAPNPMVGAVIVAADGRVIGEGWHRRCGEGHAEVNAIASVKATDRILLKDSTIYVTLEPCSHYGKTPPCSKLIIQTGIPRVVVGAGDPNPKVNGRGIAMLREAGVEVVTGMLAEESIALNKLFFTSQRLHRPYITLKWAQSADGFMDSRRSQGESAYNFSTPLVRLSTMKLRAEHEAILTTAATVNADNPRMNLRQWVGRQPIRFILDRSGRLNPDADILKGENPAVVLTGDNPFETLLADYGITSVLVEAGPRYLSALLDANLWDELRVEIAPVSLREQGAFPAPELKNLATSVDRRAVNFDGHTLLYFRNNHF